MTCESTYRGLRCDGDEGHEGYHKHDRRIEGGTYPSTWGVVWGVPQPEYPEGSIEMEPWVVQGSEFRG